MPQHGHAYVLFSRVRARTDFGAVVDEATSLLENGRRVLVTAVRDVADNRVARLKRVQAQLMPPTGGGPHEYLRGHGGSGR